MHSTTSERRVMLARPKGMISYEVEHIAQYGGVGDGITDNSSALAAFFAANPSSGVLTFGAGVYRFNSLVPHIFASSVGSYALRGLGSDITVLSWPSSDGIALTYATEFNSVHLSGMTLASGSIGNTGLKLQLPGPNINPAISAQNTLFDVVFRGADGYNLHNYWGTALYIESVSNCNLTDCYFAGVYPNGVGIVLEGVQNAYSVQTNLVGCTFNGLSIGIRYGDVNGYVQGVTIGHCNFTGVDFGVLSPTALAGISQLSVTSSQFTSFGGAAIWEDSAIEFTSAIGNLFLAGQANASLLAFIKNSEFTISGNSFISTLPAVNGIVVGTSVGGCGTIVGNTFGGLSIGVNLEAGATMINVQSNAYTGGGTPVLNSGTGNIVGGGSH